MRQPEIFMVYIQKFIKNVWSKIIKFWDTDLYNPTSSFICCWFCSDKFKNEGMRVNGCKIGDVTDCAKYPLKSCIDGHHHHESMCRLAANILIYCMQMFNVLVLSKKIKTSMAFWGWPFTNSAPVSRSGASVIWSADAQHGGERSVVLRAAGETGRGTETGTARFCERAGSASGFRA